MTTQTLPRWQKIAQEKNLDISIVEVKDLFNDKRLDAEFYNPKYLTLLSDIKNNSFDLLENIAFITDGEHGSPCWDEKSGIK